MELLVVDKVSTWGAASLEIVSRRMQQVARVLWRRRALGSGGSRCAPPEDMGPFGGVGVVLMGDFAQLPPVLASNVLPGMPLVESGGAVARALALAGRQTFAGACPDRLEIRYAEGHVEGARCSAFFESLDRRVPLFKARSRFPCLFWLLLRLVMAEPVAPVTAEYPL